MRGHDQIRRNTTLRLFAGIPVTTGIDNPTDRAVAAKAAIISPRKHPPAGIVDRSRRAENDRAHEAEPDDCLDNEIQNEPHLSPLPIDACVSRDARGRRFAPHRG
jgi:hypothetical protein